MSINQDADIWLEENSGRIRAADCRVTKSENWLRSAEQARRFDLEGSGAWGRVIFFWPGGNADMHVLDAKTAETKFYWGGRTFCDEDLKGWLTALEHANVC